MQRGKSSRFGPRPNSSGPFSCWSCCVSCSLVTRHESMGEFSSGGATRLFLRRWRALAARGGQGGHRQRHGGPEQAQRVFLVVARSGDRATTAREAVGGHGAQQVIFEWDVPAQRRERVHPARL